MQVSRLNPRIIILSFFFVVFFGLCSKAQGQTLEPRGEIRVVESWRPDVNILGYNVLQYLYMYALDRDELVPCLAISQKWVDETTLELKLRNGVRFHNGEPFDAYAVKFNFEYQRKHSLGRGVQYYIRNLEEIRVIDSHTIWMILKHPDSLFLNNLLTGSRAGWVLGAPRYMEKVGLQEFSRRPIGTGPYIVEGEAKHHSNVAEGEIYVTLVPNLDYWDKARPRLRKVQFVRYSPKEALDALIAGRVDLVTSMLPNDTLKVAESPHSKVVKGRNDVRWTMVFLNLLSPHTMALRDLRVRKALNYAVNKEELLRYAFKGNAIEMRGALTRMTDVSLSDTKTYEWNIPKARELLEDAGYGNGFKMKLFYHDKDYLIAQFLRRFYGLLNIDVEIASFSQFEWLVKHIFYPNMREGYSWEAQDWWIIVYSSAGETPEMMGLFLEIMFRPEAGWRSAPGWLLDPLKNIYNEVLHTTDRKRRLQLYEKANKYIADQALVISTLAQMSLYGVNKELNFVPQVSQYLYLDYSSVTDRHWSLRDKNN